MKHILPILTLTTLTAAAFADASAPAAAAPAGLSYNRVGLSYQTNQNDNPGHPYALSASAFIGGSNVLVSGSAQLVATPDEANAVSIGYVFKGVAAGIDATVSASSNDTYGINLRRSLGEVLSGLEVAVGYSSSTGSDKKDSWTYELAYNITKQYSLAYSIKDPAGSGKSDNNVTLRYNF